MFVRLGGSTETAGPSKTLDFIPNASSGPDPFVKFVFRYRNRGDQLSQVRYDLANFHLDFLVQQGVAPLTPPKVSLFPPPMPPPPLPVYPNARLSETQIQCLAAKSSQARVHGSTIHPVIAPQNQEGVTTSTSDVSRIPNRARVRKNYTRKVSPLFQSTTAQELGKGLEEPSSSVNIGKRKRGDSKAPSSSTTLEDEEVVHTPTEKDVKRARKVATSFL